MQSFKVCILGDPYVGKTTYIRRLTKGDFLQNYNETITPVESTYYHDFVHNYSTTKVEFEFYEFSGSEKMHHRLSDSKLEFDACIIMCCEKNKESKENIDYWIEQAKKNNSDIHIIICLNKCDLAWHNVLVNNSYQNYPYFSMSTKANYGLDKPLINIYNSLKW